MKYILIAVSAIIAVLILAGYAAFSYTFRRRKKVFDVTKVKSLPDGFSDEINKYLSKIATYRYEDVYITSYDGKKLYAKYYPADEAMPAVLMCHGYRSIAVNDFSGGIVTLHEAGYNILLPDERAHGKSGGRYITFGIKERYDCLDWIKYINGKRGEDKPLYVEGISMGANTVLSASCDMPANVRGIIADCGFSSAYAIIRKVMREMKLPPSAGMPVLSLFCRILGGFRLDKSDTAARALKKCRIPVFFVHGEADDFVPCDMTLENYAACASDKTLITVPGAKHGFSFLADRDAVVKGLFKFFESTAADKADKS